MKKIAVISIVLILLASMVMPAMAGNGNGNGHGNGNGNGNGGGQETTNQDQVRTQDKEKTRDQNKHANQVLGKFKNATDNKWMTTPFYIQGVVKSVGAYSITVTVTHANAKAKAFIGTDLVIAVNNTTQIFQITQGEEGTDTGKTETPTISTGDQSGETSESENDGERTPITLSQITAGQVIAAHGRFSTPEYYARLITVYLGGKLGGAINPKNTTEVPNTETPTTSTP